MNQSTPDNQVNYALEYHVPFVPEAGGHSVWSTIGSGGLVIDLSGLKKIAVDKSAKTVQVQAGVLSKELIQALFDDGLCVHRLSTVQRATAS